MAVRRSFRAKLLVSLLGSVAVLVLIPLLVVRQETARGIQEATQQADTKSREAFRRLEQQNQLRLSQLSTVFTASKQAAAALEGALEGGDPEVLARDVEYEFEARQMPHSLVAFTDAYGTPVLAMLEREILPGDDPVAVAAPALQVLEDGLDGVRAYRSVGGGLYSTETLLLEIGRPIGTVTVGVQITDEQVTSMAAIMGAEICFVVQGECVAGTPRARGELLDAVAQTAATGGSFSGGIDGETWRIIAGPLTESDSTIARVIAVPLSEVVAPFMRMQRALVLGGVGALLLAIVLSAVLSRSLTRPVSALVSATERVGTGDYTAKVDVQSVDELGVLGHAFNDMAHGLELKERYRGVLDKVVSPEIAEELLRGDVALGGEKREVTTVFADIVGFTRRTDGMEPMRVIAMLNECMERLSAVVEAEGGVVDKYVGDAIMAIFGAPFGRGDDTLRAVRAALGMQHAMAALNAERAQRGEAPVEVSIGMNTGLVMAGNMGSANRLNYTVIGDAVNLAARAEYAAGAGQVLMTESTLERVRDDVVVRDTGLHELRGFAQPVRLYELQQVRSDATSHTRTQAFATTLALLLTLCTPFTARAQVIPELPTLENVSIASRGGWFQLGFSGRLDIEGYLPSDEPSWIIPSTDAFIAPRLRVFGDAFFGDRFIASAELRVDRGEEPAAQSLEVRLDQMFGRAILLPQLALQAGKFVSPFGGYAQRHHTSADPLIRPPLPYDHRTILSGTMEPASPSALLTWKDRPAEFRTWGAPVIWGAPYQWGAMAFGAIGPFSYRVAGMNSAPSSEPEEWGLERGLEYPSWIAHAGVQVTSSLSFALSYNRGGWMSREFEETDTGPSTNFAHDQIIWGAEVVFALGGTKLRGEVFHDTWGVPNVGDDVVDVSWYAEAERDVATGVTLAARYGAIHFLEMEGWDGTTGRWDYDTERLQVGASWRLARNVGVRGEAAFNRTSAPRDPRDDLLSLQLWWEF